MRTLKQFFLRLQVWHIGLFLVAVAICFIIRDPVSFIANIGTELFSISITILIIDRLVQNHEQHNLKMSLVSQMRSEHNILATDAARRIRDEGWKDELEGILLYYANLENSQLYDFNLKKSNLTYGNFRNANLNGAKLDHAQIDDADLSGAHLHATSFKSTSIRVIEPDRLVLKNARFLGADLTGAKFLGVFDGIMTESEHPHLCAAFTLAGSIMPNGKRYDGRYNLEGDINQAAAQGYDIDNRQDMAEFYEVSLEEYNRGQSWHTDYSKYLETRETVAISMCKKMGLSWENMNEDQRGKFLDQWHKAP